MTSYVNQQVQQALRHVADVLEWEPWRNPVQFLRECADELDGD